MDEGIQARSWGKSAIHQVATHAKQEVPPTKLVITFPKTSKRLNNPIAAESFTEAIRQMGVERVQELGLKVGSRSLISKEEKTDSEASELREVNGYAVSTYSSTKRKKDLLERIARDLGIEIRVDIVPR